MAAILSRNEILKNGEKFCPLKAFAGKPKGEPEGSAASLALWDKQPKKQTDRISPHRSHCLNKQHAKSQDRCRKNGYLRCETDRVPFDSKRRQANSS